MECGMVEVLASLSFEDVLDSSEVEDTLGWRNVRKEGLLRR